MRNFLLHCNAILILAIPLVAQNPDHGMNMPGMTDHARQTQTLSPLISTFEQHATSGTDVEPVSTPMQMIMRQYGSWTLMFHGEAFLNELQETGPRGGAKFFSTNWFMPMAQRKMGRGLLTLRTMLSLEPATISSRQYPELFQQGETPYGKPIVDGQHPHNFFMELAAMYDYNLSEHTALSVYVAPVGDPAMGPPAYPHRLSAWEDPIAPLGHHLQDSTHIAYDVVTAGLTFGRFRLEGSGFHGREPGEDRWEIHSGKIDSWSARANFNAGDNWSFQYSIAKLTSPEALNSGQDVRRMTASLMYNRPLPHGNWALLALWGRNQILQNGNIGNSYLLESTLRFRERNNAWVRLENVDRTTELLDGANPLGPSDLYFARVQGYTAGYGREFWHVSHLAAAIGGQFMWYGVPPVLRSDYGAHPIGGLVFLHLRVR